MNLKTLIYLFLFGYTKSSMTPTDKAFQNSNISPSFVSMASKDSAEVVQDAWRISCDYGISSQEARVAWDIVEELDAAKR